jgi:GTP-binding protein HflX
LVLEVSDASSLTSAEQDAQVEIVLRELEADKKPRLHVQNKLDLVPAAERSHLANDVATVYVSATKQTGLPELLARIDSLLDQDPIQRVRLRVPQSEGKVLAELEAKSRIYARSYRDGAVDLELDAPESVLRRVGKWTVRSQAKGKRSDAGSSTRS